MQAIYAGLSPACTDLPRATDVPKAGYTNRYFRLSCFYVCGQQQPAPIRLNRFEERSAIVCLVDFSGHGSWLIATLIFLAFGGKMHICYQRQWQYVVFVCHD